MPKYYLRIDDELVTCLKVTSLDPINIVQEELGDHAFEEREGHDGRRIFYGTADPHKIYPTPELKPRLARALGVYGFYTGEPARWPIRGALWMFGPGRGWTQEEVWAESDRIRDLFDPVMSYEEYLS